MFEWDQGAYQRKFGFSISMCQVEGGSWQWRTIREITEDGLVWLYEHPEPFGEALFEYNKLKPQTDLPAVQFRYQPIECGIYSHKFLKDSFFTIQRRHLKQWKIGLDNYGYWITEYNQTGVHHRDYRAQIDMLNRRTGPIGKYHVLANNLLIKGKSLMAYDTEIGFMEAGRAILKDPAFEPLVKPYLGDAWEIVSL